MCIHCPTGGARVCEFGLGENLEIQRKGCWPKKVERWVAGAGEEKWMVADQDQEETEEKIQKRQADASEAGQNAKDSSGPAAKKIRTTIGPEIPHDQKESQDAELKIFNFKTANAKFKAIDLLKRDLGSDPALKHFEAQGWHPPKPPPPRKTYLPSAKLLPYTPIGDQTW